jgi:hypothetical protein
MTAKKQGPRQRGDWSPPDYSALVISWFVEDEDVPDGPRFRVLITLDVSRRGSAAASGDIVSTLLTREDESVPFSLRDEMSRAPFLAGELRYEAEPDTARLVVQDLRYPGGSVARHVLFP